MDVELQVLCSLEKSKIEGFASLLPEMICLVGAESIYSLQKVIIVNDDQVPKTVNTIIKAIDPSASYTPRSAYPANAVSVPLETKGELYCFIVMGKSYIEPLDTEHYHSPNTVLTLLEELLHVWVYTSAWHRRGYVQYRNRELPACYADLLTIASQMCDEYVVIRRKSHLAANLAVFEPEPGKGFMAGIINYGGNIFDEVSKGDEELEKIIVEAASGLRRVPNSWNDLMIVMYRLVFEPLSRNAAYCDDISGEMSGWMELQTIKLYRDLLSEYWEIIHDELIMVFDSNLHETETCLKKIADAIEALLGKIGVDFRKMEDGKCWVSYSAVFFDNWHQENDIG
ncbi:MAG: hypothetical protein A2029_05005 [Chloroflexi bacterium RBG_19FT_COMBO_47_9]|nr:MAG: hypothetical protein A2029_05005 [Chloroflexi bacterium RBG_19FT_COMBO_47_9]